MSRLGFGVGYRPVHFSDLQSAPSDAVDWLEIISENFMNAGGQAYDRLLWLRSHYPLAMHGVSLSIAGTDPFDKRYLQDLKSLVNLVEPKIISDHLCWTNKHGQQLHDLLPFPYTQSSLAHVSRRIEEVQEFLGRQIIIENPTTYIAFRDDEMSEAEFLAELARHSGCGILLDLNNIFVNQCNLGVSPQEYFERLDAFTVQQMHIAGHTVREDIRIDTHDQPVCQDVWELYKTALNHYPDAACMVEWDDNIPSFDRLVQELDKARNIHSENFSNTNAQQPLARKKNAQPKQQNINTLDEFQSKFTSFMTNGDEPAYKKLLNLTKHAKAAAHIGLSVYHQGYFLRLREVLSETFPTLHYILEDEGFNRLVARYLETTAMDHYSLDYAGLKLPEFIQTKGLGFDAGAENTVLADLAKLDLAFQQVFLAPNYEPTLPEYFASLTPFQWEALTLEQSPSVKFLSLDSDPRLVRDAALSASEDAPEPKLQPINLVVWRQNNEVNIEVLTSFENLCLSLFLQNKNLSQVYSEVSQQETDITMLMKQIAKWVHSHWVIVPKPAH